MLGTMDAERRKAGPCPGVVHCLVGRQTYSRLTKTRHRMLKISEEQQSKRRAPRKESFPWGLRVAQGAANASVHSSVAFVLSSRDCRHVTCLPSPLKVSSMGRGPISHNDESILVGSKECLRECSQDGMKYRRPGGSWRNGVGLGLL